MPTDISKAQDLKVLGQILHESIDGLLLELEIHGQSPPSLEQLNPEVLLAPPAGDGPRQRIVRACEKLTALVQGPMGVLFLNLSLSPISSDDIFRAASVFSIAMRENNFQVDGGKSAFSKAFQTELESFDYFYQVEPERGRRFSLGMTPFTGSYASSLALYPFKDLPRGALVVDVGGGSGHVSKEIARANPQLKFVVQDLEEPIRLGKSIYGEAGLPIEWQVHNAFHPQPVKGADVYFMRRVLHDHSDPIATKILRMIVEAMDPTSRILIEDMIAPDLYGEDSEWFTNHADLVMLMMHNAKERTLGQWNTLVENVDERLGIVKVWKGKGDGRGGTAIIEVMLR
ncbi:O-methyltransferase family protein [Colletotrichum musicola]|uniref:O-methyltransferase family protein n=1 Tax=Colletotrichum musicola TaxID=2175873 RepID=A0A8H6ISX1_9PEZI|nr:O-methyltransferase family protein [Colletotrichum musicola]